MSGAAARGVRESDRPGRLRRLRGPLGLPFLLLVCWGALRLLDRTGELAFLPEFALILAGAYALSPAQPRVVPSARIYVVLGTLFAAAIGLFFRLRYLWTVPPGWGFEPLRFVFFAQQLIQEHFPYRPYDWYAHTLYSYWIALAMLVVRQPLLAFRVASVVLSISTLVAMWLCLRRLISARAAWIGTALLGSSYWHMFASRNGYHQLQLPLFQLLFMYGLIGGVQTARFRYFLVAAVAMVLGLHCHWGFYLMPPVWLVFVLYLFVYHRDLWRRAMPGMMIAAGLTTLALVPLATFYWYHLKVFGYIGQGFDPRSVQSSGQATKLLRNLSFILWELSGHPHARAEYGPATDWLVASGTLLGLALSLRWFKRSPAHALLVILFLINCAGLAVTVGNYFYIIATMAAAYAFAAIAVAATLEQWETLSPRLAPAAFAVVVGVIGWQAHNNFAWYIGERIYRETAHPFKSPGSSYPVLPEVERLAATHTVFLPRDEPGRDFDDQLYALGDKLPAYSFLHKTHVYDVTRILFPAVETGGPDGVAIVVPNGPYVDRVILPTLRKLYPRLEIAMIMPPEPYRSEKDIAVAYRLVIPQADLRRYQGLRRKAAADGGEASLDGFLFVPEDGRYFFHHLHESTARLWLHGEEVEFGEQSATPLEAGLHPLHMVGGTPEEVLWRGPSVHWESLVPHLLNDGGQRPELFAPYLAAMGRQAPFYYSETARVPVTPSVQDALLTEGGGFAAIDAYAFRLYGSARQVLGTVKMPGPRDFRLGATADQFLTLDPSGVVFGIDDTGYRQLASIPCRPVDEAMDGDRFVALCIDGRLLASSGPSPSAEPLLAADGAPLLRPISMARAPEGYYVVDALASALLLYDEHGNLLRTQLMPHLYWDSEVRVDSEGRLYIKRRGQGMRTYSADGHLLFHPLTGVPSLFVRGERQPLDTMAPLHMKFSGDQAIATARDGTVLLYERRASPDHLDSR